jgi:bacterioferritin-associated ferredoxin
MIVCSCNVFSDHQVRSTLANATQRPRMRQIYDYLGGSAQCGRCTHTIKRIMEEMPTCAIGPVAANASLYVAETMRVLKNISIGKSAPTLSPELPEI